MTACRWVKLNEVEKSSVACFNFREADIFHKNPQLLTQLARWHPSERQFWPESDEWMSEPNQTKPDFMAIHPTAVKTPYQNQIGGARGKIKGSQKSLEFVFWERWMSEQDISVWTKVADWLTDWQTELCYDAMYILYHLLIEAELEGGGQSGWWACRAYGNIMWLHLTKTYLNLQFGCIETLLLQGWHRQTRIHIHTHGQFRAFS